MADQNNAQVVTISDAVAQVKKWALEKNYEQVKQGCEEILAVEPENKEVKDLLEEAKKALAPQQAAPAAQVATVAPVQAAPVAPAPEPVAPVTPAPAAQMSPADIFKKPAEPVKKEEPKIVAAPVTAPMPAKPAAKEPKKGGSLGTIITIVVFLALLGGFIYSFIQGWLNPFYDWILGLFGL